MGKDKAILEWIRIFEKIYSNADSKRTPEILWIGTMAHCSAMGEAIRRVNFEDLLNSATHAFCWICSYVGKCNTLKDNVFSIDDCLSGIVAFKYPLQCGHCFETPCHCSPKEMDAKKDKSAIYEKLLKLRRKVKYETFGISEWQDTFNTIYGNNIHMLTLDNIGFHFLEEVGEAAMAVRMLDQLKSVSIGNGFLKSISTIEGLVTEWNNHKKIIESVNYTSKDEGMLRARIIDAKVHMVIEIADTFSWFCSILNKVKTIYEINKLEFKPFEERLDEEYIKDGTPKCPTCGNTECSCVFFL